MGRNRRIVTSSREDTLAFGETLGKECRPNTVLCFFGDLGSGKTTLIKGIVKGTLGIEEEEINSPTFIYLNIYEGKIPIYHFDLYRLKNEEEFLALGFEEYLFGGGICCIEWSERIEKLLPPHSIRLYLSHLSQNARSITLFEL